MHVMLIGNGHVAQNTWTDAKENREFVFIMNRMQIQIVMLLSGSF